MPDSKTKGDIELDEDLELEVIQSSHAAEEESDISSLALMDPKNQLRFLDGVVFAADDSEAIAALKSITLHQLWSKAYLSPQMKWFQAPMLLRVHSHGLRRSRKSLEDIRRGKNLDLPQGYNYQVDGEVVEPRLMQKHVAVLAKEHRQFLMSDMGPKSLAACCYGRWCQESFSNTN